MQAPLSTHELAQRRDASGPSPVRRMSNTPSITPRGVASAMPAGWVIGQASTHLPQRVQASVIVSTRAASAASKSIGCMGPIIAVAHNWRKVSPITVDLPLQGRYEEVMSCEQP